MEDNILDIPVKKTRQRTFTKEILKEDKPYLNEDDIWKIVENMKIDDIISKDKAKEIFQELDRDKTGEVLTSDFMDLISNTQGKELSIEADLLSRRIRNGIYTKAEKIIKSPRKLLSLEQIIKDKLIFSELSM